MITNNRNFDHAVNLIRNAGQSNALQNSFNEKRFARFERALYTRPVLLPIQYLLKAAGATSPYDNEMPVQGYPLIVTGLMSDNPARKVELKESTKDIPYIFGGDNRTIRLTLGELGGRPQTGAEFAQIGGFDLPSPILIEANNRLTINVFKPENSDTDEFLNVVLRAWRVYPKAGFDADERVLINNYLNRRRLPRTAFLKLPVEFIRDPLPYNAPAGTPENISGKTTVLFTPQSDEPLLIRGFRTTLKYSTIDVGLEGEAQWTVKPAPIWSLASNETNKDENFMALQRPVYLAGRKTLEMTFNNSIDGTNYDPLSGNTITLITETV